MDNNNNNHNSNDEVKHTVYISFNKNDSSVSSFISYLIAAFNRQGIISAFVDGKSSHDEAVEREMGPEEFSRLRVVVVVFSKNYALHVSFLEKQILEYSYRNNNDFVVVPVFYGVSVSSVKQHMERFVEEFDAVQRSMIKWRPGHEYDCIFGEPSIGKTTLATAFFRRISHGYDDSCFIKDFHKEYTEKRLEYLPPKYLGKTSMEKFDLKSFDSQPSHRKKWVLVALDDVQNAQDAKSFLGGYDKFGPGSLIIITSRKRKILEQCHMNKIYELKGLNDEDALKLFTRCAFGNGVIEQNLLDLSKRVVECSDGNPNTLRSFAKKLKGKAVEKISSTFPDDCDVFVADDVSCDTEKNTYLRIVPCEEDDE
ncbi:Toll/interleukin-1 receptor homology (TIR) domain [Arabidopsis thaliana x Arabidopsis arenosa]|uniref:Toll/interleukin-1 receptor homology (TIR) domain n=1 Tax=Arabidopsis thaliana x Arabidopsis arenosa TaxID=1240361 RepID=A0A8T1XJ80_9BRAS|nr:Toll/interleukin-1 receptor homology (TIR) domain [Arabidopsis thaliana x Arabidopsis arenosa]